MDEKLLTLKQVAQILQVHPITISRWAREGKITLVYLPYSNRQRMTQAELERIKSITTAKQVE